MRGREAIYQQLPAAAINGQEKGHCAAHIGVPGQSMAQIAETSAAKRRFLVEKITATRALRLLLGMPINRAFLLTLPRATNIP